MTRPTQISLESQILEEELMRRFEARQTAREIAKSLKERLQKSEAALAASRRRLDSYHNVYSAVGT